MVRNTLNTSWALSAADSGTNRVQDSGEDTAGRCHHRRYCRSPLLISRRKWRPRRATVALAERIFGEMGYEVQAELVDWDNLIPGLNAERFDAISAGMSITPERCEEAAFAEPEIMYTTALVVEAGNPYGVENLDDVLEAQESGEDITLTTLTAGIEAGYATDLGLDYEGVGSADEGLEMVQGGRADVFAMTAISLNQMVEDADDVEVTDPFVQEIDGVLQYGAGSTVFRQDDTETI